MAVRDEWLQIFRDLCWDIFFHFTFFNFTAYLCDLMISREHKTETRRQRQRRQASNHNLVSNTNRPAQMIQ